jgi:hypothetical protein
MKTIRVFSLDVWGNERDGWDVNDRSECMRSEVEDNFFELEDKLIIRWLKDQELIGKRIHNKSVSIDGDGESYLYIDDARNNRPEYQIELV